MGAFTRSFTKRDNEDERHNRENDSDG